MLPNSDQANGVALLCDASGKIKEIIDDDFGLLEKGEQAEDRLLTSFFDKESVQKGLRMLQEIDDEGIAYDWEINLASKDMPNLLFFSGIKSGGDILLIGSPATDRKTDYYNKLMEINNEHINKLRQLIKERSLNEREEGKRDRDLYEEMSELNNELASAQRKLAKQKAELERINEMKNQMLGMAAHDLRNPLSVIQALSSLLLEDEQFNEQQKKYLNEIHKSSEFMLRIIEDMLDISAIESGSVNLEKEETELVDFIERVISLNERAAGEKEINLQTDLPDKKIIVEIDPHKFEQVLNNLISNAIKYSPENTTVTAGVEETDSGIRLYVEDEGQGIPEEDIDKLFQPFANINVEATGGEKSTGLGLAITKKILDAHGYDIWVESEVGKGTTFFINLPREN